MRKYGLTLLLIAFVCAVALAGSTELLKIGTVTNSTTYKGASWTKVGTDTAAVNRFVMTALGPVHVTVNLRVRAYGKESGLARIDSFLLASGGVRVVGGITNDSLMRIWLPPGIVADSTNNPAASILKQTRDLFEYRVEVVAKSTSNGGSLFVAKKD
ncbi:MAG TPA: hypothetical protein PK916_08835 [Bacteroidota bacterium]|nr:hypothetical protein [Bacteroidota bacterium]